MNQNRSVATINKPEFINLKPDALNPGISKCEIKVLYLGGNRNGSYIDKNTAIQMANSLPGCPIVGAYLENKEDFGDHGHVMTIEDGEVRFSCKTVPYGFVDPAAKVWFQTFIDTDEFGEEIEREYMMTTGFLWTEQYEEAQSVITDGKGQSMELDEETLDGHWARNNKTGIEFFIINDAIFTKLCILGDEVEPCFEGAAITKPEVSKEFSYGREFSRTLFTMMNELKDMLYDKGGLGMPKPEELDPQMDNVAEETEFAVRDEEEEKKKIVDSKKNDEDENEKAADPEDQEEPADEEEEDDKKKMTQNSLASDDKMIAELQSELEELREFKHQIENKRKDELIGKYHMLSNEDKADVIANKEEYSYEEIESKLALIYVNKNVDFSTITGEKAETETNAPVVFSLENSGNAENAPGFVEALRLAKEF